MEETLPALPVQQPFVWVFRDREDAGRQLAQRLGRYRLERPIVLALPRGGVPLAYQVAEALAAPLDVLPVRKLGCPGRSEIGIGAIALDGEPIWDWQAMRTLRVSEVDLAQIEAGERLELERQRRLFRGDRPMPDLRGRTVIIVDDGLATGATARAAIQAVRSLGAKRLVLAVPVGAPDAVAALWQQVDDLVCLVCPAPFIAVGLWYRDFGPVPDATVITLLERAGRRMDGERPAGGRYE